jgi:hypothetical protein
MKRKFPSGLKINMNISVSQKVKHEPQVNTPEILSRFFRSHSFHDSWSSSQLRQSTATPANEVADTK